MNRRVGPAGAVVAGLFAACGFDGVGAAPPGGLAPVDAASDSLAPDGAPNDGSFDGGDGGEVDAAPATYPEVVLADGPLHYWRFEEPAGSATVADVGTPGGNRGTVIGNVSLAEPSAFASLGTSARFDGNGIAGTRIDVGLFHPGSAVTVEVWAKLEASANKSFHSIFARWDGSYEIDVAQSSQHLNFVAQDARVTLLLVESQAAVTRDAWHHMVGVFSPDGELTTYLDGVKGTTLATIGALRNAGFVPDRVLIGATRTGVGGSAFNFTGWIDEVAIYGKALSAADVQRHFTAAR